ncbi:hypothetical protein XENOCAPTIV_011859, partial [Xenoophorus captivus]
LQGRGDGLDSPLDGACVSVSRVSPLLLLERCGGKGGRRPSTASMACKVKKEMVRRQMVQMVMYILVKRTRSWHRSGHQEDIYGAIMSQAAEVQAFYGAVDS